MLRIWSWNVNGLDVWDRFVSDEVDIVLLQEARLPAQAWQRPVAPDPAGGWRTAGWGEGTWSRRTAVVQVSDAASIRPVALTGVSQHEAGAVPVSRPGTLAAAEATIGGEAVTLVSMYAGWETSVDGRGLIYADAAAHRLLSDLAAIVTTSRQHRVIAAGDLNILNRYGEHGHPYWAGRYATVFDRAEAMGLRFIGPKAPHGRQASPRPAELPEDCRDVPTYHTRGQGPMGATRQLDFVFASEALAERITVRALNTTDTEWGASDHCRIAIEIV